MWWEVVRSIPGRDCCENHQGVSMGTQDRVTIAILPTRGASILTIITPLGAIAYITDPDHKYACEKSKVFLSEGENEDN